MIPVWLKENIKETCSCGSSILNLTSTEGKYTQRFCSNPKCYKHMGAAIEKLAKKMQVVGVGIVEGERIASMTDIEYSIDAVGIWFPENKPVRTLSEIAELCDFEGISSRWQDILGNSNNPEVLKETPYQHCIPKLKKAIKYFELKEVSTEVEVVKVMMTGHFHGYSRPEFLAMVNQRYGQVLRVLDNKKTVRGTMCLIKEEGAVDHEKSAIAERHNIPIVTPKEFIETLDEIFAEGGEENSEA